MDWFEEGKKHIWHPYSQAKTAKPPMQIVDAEGSIIKLQDGRELVDGIASWWSMCHGYKHPHIIDKMENQLRQLPHIMFAGFAHEPAYLLAKRLADMLPAPLERVFFADSGSVSVEIALKMAVQYWRNIGERHRNRFVSFKNCYHGDTMGAMSLADSEHSMHKAFHEYMPMQFVLDLPNDEYSFAEFDDILKKNKKQIAAVIIEPLVQAAGGMKFHGADILAEIYHITKKHEILFIADEMATGFGRTGYMFAFQEAGIVPDILCIGKALTGGYITLAATIATTDIFDAFYGDELEKAFMHGPTYMANPLACSAANASLDLFQQEPRLAQVAHIECMFEEFLSSLKHKEQVIDVRVKGAIGVVELDANWDYIFALRSKFTEYGVYLRPFGNVLYIMPPFTITDCELRKIFSAIETVL